MLSADGINVLRGRVCFDEGNGGIYGFSLHPAPRGFRGRRAARDVTPVKWWAWGGGIDGISVYVYV